MDEYKCKRCGKSAKEANLSSCQHAPCPMEYVSSDSVLVSSKLFRNTKITVLILSALLVVAIVMIWNAYSAKKTVNVDTSYFDRKIEQLNTENDSLRGSIELDEKTIIEYDHMVDSLLSLKPEIKIKYVKIYERVDNANVVELVNLSDSIYSAEGVHH